MVGGNIGVVAVRPRSRVGRLRLLGHRGVQLPGHRPAVLAAGGRGDLAAPGPPRLARRGRAVLPGQAVRVLPAGRRTHRGQRRQRPARRAGGLLGPRVEWVSARRRARRGLDGAARTARAAQPAQRAHRPPLPGRPRRARRRPTTPRCAPPPPATSALPSRLTPIGTVDGVTFVDDSLSTNVLPTLAALDAFPGRRIALIVGGHDRGIDYAPLAAGVAGPPGAHLRADPPRQRPPHPRRDRQAALDQAARNQAPDQAPLFAGVTDCPDLESAVAAAFPWAQARTAWSCCRRPRPASASSATTATAAKPSPAPCARSPSRPAPRNGPPIPLPSHQ